MNHVDLKESSRAEAHTTWPQRAFIFDTRFEDLTDRCLFETIQNGLVEDKKLAFDEFYNRYAMSLAKQIAHWLHQPVEADGVKEVFSETWAVTLRIISSFSWEKEANTPTPEKSLLFTTARNKMFEYQRNVGKEISLEDIREHLLARLTIEIEDESDNPGQASSNSTGQSPLHPAANRHLLQVAQVLKKSGELDPESQIILNLRYFNNRNFAEIGEQLGKTEGSVRTKHHRIVEKLRRQLEQDGN